MTQSRYTLLCCKTSTPHIMYILRSCLTACALALLLLAGCASSHMAKTGPAQALLPEDTLSDEEFMQVRRGVRAHDQGDFAGARSFYDSILANKPNSPIALYQKAYAYQQEGNLQACVEVAERGFRIRSTMRFELLHLHGICLDMSGQPERALESFRAGIRENPDYLRLNYSVGVTLENLLRHDEAIRAYESALAIDVSHASSHLGIAQVYKAMNLKFAASLAYTYFLFYERDTDRSFAVRESLYSLLSSVRKSQEGDQTAVNINLNILTSPDDPMNAAELALGLSTVSHSLPERANWTEAERLYHQLSTIFRIGGEVAEKSDAEGAVWGIYVPFLSQLEAAGHTEALTYLNFQGLGLEGVERWLDENDQKVQDFIVWLDSVQ